MEVILLLSLLLWFESIMMIELPHPEALQDSIPVINIQTRDSVSLRSDTVSLSNTIQQKDSLHHRIKIVVVRPISEITDTITVCRRNSIEDVTFYDSCNLVTRLFPFHKDNFPFLFTMKNREIEQAAKATLVKQLKPGDDIPLRSLHEDWLILIIVTIAFLYAIIRKSSDSLINSVERFFLFRGMNDAASRDTGGLFTWESTLKNLLSFFVLGLFAYYSASYNNLIPVSLNGFIFWLITVLVIITVVSLRHIVCLATGAVSEEREVFQEYLVSIYQFYRFSAILIFVVTILISYTSIFSIKYCFTAGGIILTILYLIRVLRLFIIFINKNISLFYLILYLCALEILPVFITVKYISGLA